MPNVAIPRKQQTKNKNTENCEKIQRTAAHRRMGPIFFFLLLLLFFFFFFLLFFFFWGGGGGGLHTPFLPVLPESRIHARISRILAEILPKSWTKVYPNFAQILPEYCPNIARILPELDTLAELIWMSIVNNIMTITLYSQAEHLLNFHCVWCLYHACIATFKPNINK